MSRTQTAGGNGFYEFANLPIGTYSLTFTRDGFKAERIASIPIQGDRTGTVNAQLTVGAVNTVVSVDAVPLRKKLNEESGMKVIDPTQ